MRPRLRRVVLVAAGPLLSAAVLLVAGCRFERRPDVPSAGTDPDVVVRSGLSDSPMEDSARAVVAALEEALAVGDVSRVVRLTVPGAVLLDQEDAVRWSREQPDLTLPRPLGRQADGLAWRLEASRFFPFDGGGLLVHEYGALVAGENVPWTAVESLVLVRTGEGWRTAWMHRSRGLAHTGGPG